MYNEKQLKTSGLVWFRALEVTGAVHFLMGGQKTTVLALSVFVFPINFFEALVRPTLPHLWFEDVFDATLGATSSDYRQVVSKTGQHISGNLE